MKKRIMNLIVPIQQKISRKKTTTNIHYFINKIPCDAQRLSEPSAAKRFIDEEMSKYPISKKLQSQPRVSKHIENKVKAALRFNRQTRLLQLALSLEKNLTYLQLEEVRQLLALFSAHEVATCKKQLKRLSNKLSYKLNSEEKHQCHVRQSAQLLIQEINQVVVKRSKQIA